MPEPVANPFRFQSIPDMSALTDTITRMALSLRDGDIITSSCQLVTPELAHFYLSKNDRNRRMRESRVQYFRKVIESGRWVTTHQGIALYQNGHLADGQHRLAAIAQSKCAVRVMVSVVPDNATIAIDTGAMRSATDVFRIIEPGDGRLTKTLMVATVRACMGKCSISPGLPSLESVRDYYHKYQTHFDAVWKLVQEAHMKHKPSVLLACLVSAHYHGETKEDIARLLARIQSGVTEGTHESGAIRVRDKLARVAGSWQKRTENAMNIQSAIEAFCRGRSMSRFANKSQWVYPFPE